MKEAQKFIEAENRKVWQRYGYVPKLHPSEWQDEQLAQDKLDNQTYLGDGVYASFDGYQIWLAVNHHENKVVALEPSALDRLYKYAKMLQEKT